MARKRPGRKAGGGEDARGLERRTRVEKEGSCSFLIERA